MWRWQRDQLGIPLVHEGQDLMRFLRCDQCKKTRIVLIQVMVSGKKNPTRYSHDYQKWCFECVKDMAGK